MGRKSRALREFFGQFGQEPAPSKVEQALLGETAPQQMPPAMPTNQGGFVDPRILKWLGLGGAGAYIGGGLLEEDVEESEMAERFRPRQY